MKIVVTGGSGFIGRALCRSLVQQGMSVAVLSRNLPQAKATLDPAIKLVEWDAVSPGPWEHELVSADAVINLAGEPIAEGRWTPKRKQLIVDSRVNATGLLVQAGLSQAEAVVRRGNREDRVGLSSVPQEQLGESVDVERVFREQ